MGDNFVRRGKPAAMSSAERVREWRRRQLEKYQKEAEEKGVSLEDVKPKQRRRKLKTKEENRLTYLKRTGQLDEENRIPAFGEGGAGGARKKPKRGGWSGGSRSSSSSSISSSSVGRLVFCKIHEYVDEGPDSATVEYVCEGLPTARARAQAPARAVSRDVFDDDDDDESRG